MESNMISKRTFIQPGGLFCANYSYYLLIIIKIIKEREINSLRFANSPCLSRVC